MFGGILIYKRILINNQNISKIANIGKEQEKQELLKLCHKVKSKGILFQMLIY